MKNLNCFLAVLFSASLLLTVGCKKDSLVFEEDFSTDVSNTELNQTQTDESEDLILGSKNILVVGSPTALASELGMTNAVSIATNTPTTADTRDQDLSTVTAEVRGVDAIFVNAAAENTLEENPYVKAALQNGVTIIAEKISSSDMAALAGIGVKDAHAAIIRTKGSTQQLALTVVAEDLDPIFKEAVEEMESLEDTELSAEQIAQASQLHDADFSESVTSRSEETTSKKIMTQNEIADLINRGMALQDKAIAREPAVENRSGGFEFSIAGIDFTTINNTWNSNGQSNQIMIAFDVQLVAAVSPYYKKYVRIRPKTTSFFKPKSQKHSSWTDKGYYQDKCEIGIGYASAGNGFALDQKAPSNANGSSTITTSTQFGFSSNFGASLDGPTTGVGINYSEGTSETQTVNDFNVYAENTGSYAKFKFHLSSHYSWTSLRDWRWTGTPVFSSRQAYVKDVPHIAKNALTPYCDIVLTAPGAYNDNKQVKVDLYQRVRRTWVSSQSWPNANWSTYWYSMSYTYYFDVNFAKVNYPHMGIDQQTAISSQYPGWDKSRAVDGFTSGAATSATAQYGTNPYIDVILPASKYIYDIDIWNDVIYPHELSNYYVFISDTPFTSTDPNVTKNQPGVDFFYHSGQSPRVKKFNSRRMGKYVRVQHAGTYYLTVGEIALNPRRQGQ